MTSRRRIWMPAVTTTGAAGLLLAHWVTYLAAVPDPRLREVLLARTGHGYLPGASEVAGALALGAVLALFLSGFGERGSGDRPAFSRLAGRLISLQVSIFVVMEVAERISARAPLAEMLHDHVLLIGIAVQVVIAAAGALLLRWLDRAAERLSGIFARPLSLGSGAGTALLPAAGASPSLPRFGAAGVRGPPSA